MSVLEQSHKVDLFDFLVQLGSGRKYCLNKSLHNGRGLSIQENSAASKC